MAIKTAMCTSFKKELLEGKHDFNASSGDTFKIALYTSSATLGASTTDYSSSNEVTGTLPVVMHLLTLILLPVVLLLFVTLLILHGLLQRLQQMVH